MPSARHPDRPPVVTPLAPRHFRRLPNSIWLYPPLPAAGTPRTQPTANPPRPLSSRLLSGRTRRRTGREQVMNRESGHEAGWTSPPASPRLTPPWRPGQREIQGAATERTSSGTGTQQAMNRPSSRQIARPLANGSCAPTAQPTAVGFVSTDRHRGSEEHSRADSWDMSHDSQSRSSRAAESIAARRAGPALTARPFTWIQW